MQIVNISRHCTLAEFADAHDLVLEVHEYLPVYHDSLHFGAKFRNCELIDGLVLKSQPGHGATAAEAINSYASLISNKRLKRYLGKDQGYETLDVPILDL